MTREEKLMMQTQQGDAEAVEELIGLLYPEILRYCLWHAPNRDLAEDAAQETFLKAIRYYDRYVHKGKCKAFLYRIAANTCVDMHRRMRAGESSIEEIPEELSYDGIPISTLGQRYRDVFGYLPQEFGFYPEFTVQDYLEYVAVLKGLTAADSRRKIGELLEQLTLTQVRRKKIAKLSGGMKRRVGIAQALLNEPEVLILDEPTSGLDPGERVRFRNLLSEFAHDRIVLISTHIVSDVEYIATRNAVMKGGKLLACGTTEELVRLVEGKVWTATIPASALGDYERKLPIVNLRNEENGEVSIRYLAQEAAAAGSAAVAPRLEDLYLWLFPQETLERR